MNLMHATAVAHIVMWRLNGADPEARRQQAQVIVEAFEATRSLVPGVLRMELGPNIVESPDAWDLALCMVFATRADLDAYQTHPAHLRIKALVGPLRSERGQIDFEIPA